MIIGISGKKQSGKDTVAKIIQYLICLSIEKQKFIDVGEFMKNREWYIGRSENYREQTSGWQRKLFADKLKDIVCMFIGCTREQLEDNTFKETSLGEEWKCYMVFDNPYPSLFPLDVDIEWIAKGRKYKVRVMTPRMLLQLLGTDCGRKIIHPNIWVNSLMSEYKITNKTIDGIYGEMFTPIYPNWIITDVRFPNEAQAIKDKGGIIIRVNRPLNITSDRVMATAITLHTYRKINSPDLHESETSLDDYTEFDYTITNDKRIEELINKVELVLEKANLLK